MIHVEEHKKPQHDLSTQQYLHPKKLYLPLSQHTGSPSKPCVKKGDTVAEGQIIANADGFISANLHAPSYGTVAALDTCNHPILKKAPCVVIQCHPKHADYPQQPDWQTFSKEALLNILTESGIVGLGGAAFPTHVKLTPPKKIDTLIINGCECEPYLATDNRMMCEYPREIMYGAEIICRIIQPQRLIIAIENNKPQAIKAMGETLSREHFSLPRATIAVLKSAYPQGGEKQLIYNTTRRIVPSKKLPLDVGCLVQNVATCFAIHEAISRKKPLIERLVGFYGDALEEPKNVWLKIGTSMRELFDEKILTLKNDPKQIIAGGPMMGVSINSLDYPITKANGGFLFLNRSILRTESPCIRCARCVDVCPMGLLPLEYAKYAKKNMFEPLNDLHIRDCIECGCCAYSCPAAIPLVHYIKIGKTHAS